MAFEGEARYPYVPTVRQTGAETFTGSDTPGPADLLSFWQWSASDLIGNTMRGCLAEYIVAMALGLTSGVRNDWEAYDLTFNGWKIEVKASGYIQSWPQNRLSRPVFSVRPARSWEPSTGRMSSDVRRQADVYIFCLHDHKDKMTLKPMDLSQWSFYVVPTVRLERSDRYRNAKTISLSSLLTLNPSKASFNDLRECIIALMDQVRSD